MAASPSFHIPSEQAIRWSVQFLAVDPISIAEQNIFEDLPTLYWTSWSPPGKNIRLAGRNFHLSSIPSPYMNAKTRRLFSNPWLGPDFFSIPKKNIIIFIVLCPYILINILNSWLKFSEANPWAWRSHVTRISPSSPFSLNRCVRYLIGFIHSFSKQRIVQRGNDMAPHTRHRLISYIWSYLKRAAPDNGRVPCLSRQNCQSPGGDPIGPRSAVTAGTL